MTITRDQLEAVFAATILAENPNLTPSLQEGQDLYFNQIAVSQVGSTVSQEIQLFENNIFPASSSNALLSQHAASLGIPNIAGSQPTQGTFILTATGNPTTNFSILSGTILTNPSSAIQYIVTTTINFITTQSYANTPVPFQSVLSGSNTYSSPQTSLILGTPIVVGTLTITNATINNDVASGLDTPTNADISALVANYMQNPKGGGSTGDYFKWALESTSLITFAKIIPNGATQNQNVIYVSGMVASGDPSVNIGLEFPISRSASFSTINTMGTYIESIRPINDNPLYATVSTYAITNNTSINPTNPNPSIVLRVILATGLSLNTIVQGNNGLSLTVSEWITYQTRYAVLSAPYTGTILPDGKPYILGSDIINIIKSGLNASQYLQGYLCSILIDVTFKYNDNTYTDIQNIPVPNDTNYFIAASGIYPANLQIIYDLDTSICTVELE